MYNPQPYRRSQGRGMPSELELSDGRPGLMPRVRRDPISNNFKLHVSSIPFSWTETVMRNVFSKVGKPLNIFISPKTYNELKWGFVEFAKFHEAQTAIQELNNNVLLKIHVAFAREKNEEYDDGIDPILEFLAKDEERFKSSESLVDPRKLVKVVKNKELSFDLPIVDLVKPIYSPDSVQFYEEVIFRNILNVYKEEDFTSSAKCSVCANSCCKACSGCGTFYCSESCQGKDWPRHSQTCKGSGSEAGGGAKPRSFGDNHSETNGYGSFDNRSRGMVDGKNRFNDNNRTGDRRNNQDDRGSFRDNDRGSFRDNDRGSFRDNDRGRNNQDDRGSFRGRGAQEERDNGVPKRSMFEERKMKMVGSTGPAFPQGPQTRYTQNNLKISGFGNKPQTNEKEEWGAQTKDSVEKGCSDISPGIDFINKEKAFLQEIKKEVVSAATNDTDTQKTITIKSEPEPETEKITNDVPSVTATATTDNAKAIQSKVSKSVLPPLLDESKFTTVMIAFEVPDTVEEGAYYVGSMTFFNTLVEMGDHFRSVIHQCNVITPKCGEKGLALYSDMWYRVEIVSENPLMAFFIDYGNTDAVEPGTIRRCPETHIDIPNLVQKIKLAKGTAKKYFNLPDGSEIRVKPVSSLADGTVVVHVEGETYDVPAQPSSAPEPVAEVAIPEAAEATSENVAEVLNEASEPVVKAEISTMESTRVESPNVSNTSTTSSGSVETQVICSFIPNIVDQLEEKLTFSFVPSKVDYKKSSLIGSVFSEVFELVVSFLVEYAHIQKTMPTQAYDPNFKPAVGEIVGILNASEWERAKVLPMKDLVGLYDVGGVVRRSQLYKLPESYVNHPSMAAELTLRKEDPELLNELAEKTDIELAVVAIRKTNGRTVVEVRGAGSEAELRPWTYEPLETADPLTVGRNVFICKLVDSNTLLVLSDEEQEFDNRYQIASAKSSAKFQSPPTVGDFVSYLDKDTQGYYRCRIDKVEGEKYFLFAVDEALKLEGTLEDLRPLTTTFRNAPCRISQIELKDVPKITPTEQAVAFWKMIHEKLVKLTITDIDGQDKVTLTIQGEQDTVNSKVKLLLEPPIVPNEDGKLTIMSLPVLSVPLNEQFNILVAQTDPLYFQLSTTMVEYYKFHAKLQLHCASDTTSYNPCVNELCLAQFEGDWYRCRCLKETNQGVSVLMLVDYGNIFETETSGIRKILPDLVSMPSCAIPCKIQGLPNPVPHALRARLDDLLFPESVHVGTFVAVHEDTYEVVIESVKKAIEELK